MRYLHRTVLSVGLLSFFAPAIALGASVDSSAFKKHIGERDFDRLAKVVTSAGDMNGDGYEDFLISSDSNNSSTGIVYLRYGDDQPLGGNVQVENLASFVGTSTGDLFGTSAAGVGDFNGDGYDDVIVGASGAAANGAAYYIPGKAAQYTGAKAAENLPTTLIGTPSHDNLGNAVAGLGDMNGDGFDDFAVAASSDNFNGSNAGAIHVYYGSTAGLTAGEVNAGNHADMKLIGPNSSDRLGSDLAGLGDVNGDGLDDFVVGASGLDVSYVVLGSTTVMNGRSGIVSQADSVFNADNAAMNFAGNLADAGDINGDGKADLLIGNPGYGDEGAAFVFYAPFESTEVAPDAVFEGEEDGNLAGAAVAGVGDTNGDGYDDFMISDPSLDESHANQGVGYLYYGQSTRFSGTLGLSSADKKILGGTSQDNAGTALGAAGDTNGDGYSEILIAAASESSGGDQAGAVYLGYINVDPFTLDASGTIIDTERNGNGRILVTYSNGARDRINPFGGKKKFRYKKSTDKKSIVVTNGKRVRVYRYGERTANKKINTNKIAKKKHIKLKVASIHGNYDTVAVATRRKKKGKLSVLRLNSSHKLKKKKSSVVSVPKKQPKLRLRNGKKKIRVKWGKKTFHWKLKKKGSLQELF
jgi:hypothetical protein